MKLVNNPDKSLIPKWEIEVQDWPGDNKWIANGAFQQYQSGSYLCTVAIDDMDNLAAIATYKKYSTDAALKELGSAIVNKKEPRLFGDILHKADFRIPGGREKYHKEVDSVLQKYPVFDEDIMKSLPSTALSLEGLAGIGVGGAGNILRYLISQNKFIYLEMFLVKQNIGFYKHFGFKRLLNTKYMYLIN